ncbi:PTS sugar transporter [Paenibacillus sp. FSL H7-0331]|nr:PTS sugar transporter [Paenibacillus sp. FSL H7-0331]
MRLMYMLQQIGRSLMIPIAVLPVAAILLRIGSIKFDNPILLHFAQICGSGGSAIFDNLSLLFAIGIAIGLTSGEGIAALAATAGYLVFNNVLKHFETGAPGVVEKLDMGILGGIFCGVISATFFEKFHNIKLPKALGFFGGRRFIPLITSLAMVVFGVIMGFIWPPVQIAINQFGMWIVDAGSPGVFVYGFLNRLLIPTGLHHILNNIAWFQIGNYVTPAGRAVTGDMTRYFAGDPTAGMFMTGFYPVMMFGLPAAVLAMIKGVHPSNRSTIVPVLYSAGLTSILTGVTEPIEFAFMFVAPGLYVIHALLTGCSMMIMNMLQAKLGFGFSAGFIDMAMNLNFSSKLYWILIVGLIYFVVYYFTFRTFIRFFHFETPGSEVAKEGTQEEIAEMAIPGVKRDRTASILLNIGGASNIVSVDACITRLRLLVKDEGLIKEPELKELGAIGVIRLGKGNVHLVFGTESEQIRESMMKLLPFLATRNPNSAEVTYD